MKVELYVYYGTLTTESEVTSFMKQIGYKDHLYTFIMEKGIKYRKVGDVKNSREIVIGKEITGNFNTFIVRLDAINNVPRILPQLGSQGSLVKISEEEEKEVKKKLYQAGVYAEPQYYLFINYEN